jgi:hypothetical protein
MASDWEKGDDWPASSVGLLAALVGQNVTDARHTTDALIDNYKAQRDDMARELVETLDALAEIPPYAMSVTVHNILARTQWAYDAACRHLDGPDAR